MQERTEWVLSFLFLLLPPLLLSVQAGPLEVVGGVVLKQQVDQDEEEDPRSSRVLSGVTGRLGASGHGVVVGRGSPTSLRPTPSCTPGALVPRVPLSVPPPVCLALVVTGVFRVVGRIEIVGGVGRVGVPGEVGIRTVGNSFVSGVSRDFVGVISAQVVVVPPGPRVQSLGVPRQLPMLYSLVPPPQG